MVVLAALAVALVGGLSLLFPLMGWRLHQAALQQRTAESAAAPLTGRLERGPEGLRLTLAAKSGALLPVTLREWVWPPSLADATGVIAPDACLATSDRQAGEPLRWHSALPVEATGLTLEIAARMPQSGAGTLALLLDDAAGRRARLWIDLPVQVRG